MRFKYVSDLYLLNHVRIPKVAVIIIVKNSAIPIFAWWEAFQIKIQLFYLIAIKDIAKVVDTIKNPLIMWAKTLFFFLILSQHGHARAYLIDTN